MAGYARKYRLITEEDFDRFETLRRTTEETIRTFAKSRVKTDQLGVLAERFTKFDSVTVETLLKQPNVGIDEVLSHIMAVDGMDRVGREVLERAAISIRYHGYIEKQGREIAHFKKLEHEKIPEQFTYLAISGLRTEAREKFSRFRPISLGQAGRIEGITPGDLAVLSVHLKRFKATVA
jgi:tRNA uridine 5-carboxymethylaminomethyl modification enzyme